MVEQVSSSVRVAATMVGSHAQKMQPAVTPASGQRGSSSADSRPLGAVVNLPKALNAGPPIELPIVKQIRQEMANGTYPIDVEKITAALIKDLHELVL